MNHLPPQRNNTYDTEYLTDLVKISFSQGHFLANNGKSLCTVPSPCMEELLSSLHFIQIKHLEKAQLQVGSQRPKEEPLSFKNKIHASTFHQQSNSSRQECNQRTPIKVGQIFYIQFYFTGEFIHHDHQNNKLVLSKAKRTPFKIIEHTNKVAFTSKSKQTYDYIGNVLPDEHRYLIVVASQLLYLKFTDSNNSVYLGNYDQKCIVTFTHSLLHKDTHAKHIPLLQSPCRLYSVQQEKYVAFDIANNQIRLSDRQICLQGMCTIQTPSFQLNELDSPTLPYHRKKSRVNKKQTTFEHENKICIRILQRSNSCFMVHENDSAEKLANDINRMISPMQQRNNISNTSFLKRYQPTFTINKQTTFNLSNISSIPMEGGNNLGIIEQEEKQELVEELKIKEVDFSNLSYKFREDITFYLEHYPSYNNQFQIFIYDLMQRREKNYGRQVFHEKFLYLDSKLNISTNKYRCILKEYNNQKIKRQSLKYKNILRIEFITKDMLEPYKYYSALLLNLNVYNHYKPPVNPNTNARRPYSEQRYKLRLNITEIEEILTEYYEFIKVMQQLNKDKCYNYLNQLLQMDFISILEDLLQAVINKKKSEQREAAYLTIHKEESERENQFDSIAPVKIVSEMVFLIAKIMPQKLIHALLNTPKALLFIRICKFHKINRIFCQIECICDERPRQMLAKIEQIIKQVQQHFAGSACRNICILWGYRIQKAHQLASSTISTLSQQLINNYKNKLNEDFLIILELIRLSKGDLFYSKQIIKYLSWQKVQQQEIPFALRELYLNRIIDNYKNVISLPFKSNLEEEVVFLEKDNKSILEFYLSQHFVKNVKFQTIENKLFAFQFCELYLHFNEGLLQDVLIDYQECKDYLPLAIVILEQHLDQYVYEQRYENKYIIRIIRCLELILRKYIRFVTLEEREASLDNDQNTLRNCIEEYNQIITKKQAYSSQRKKHLEITNAKSPQKSKSYRQRQNGRGKERPNKLKKGQHSGPSLFLRASRVLENLFQKSSSSETIEMIQSVDKQIIWSSLRKPQKEITNDERLTIFQTVVNLATLLLSPALTFKQEMQSLTFMANKFSSKFKQVLTLISNKVHESNISLLIRTISQSCPTQEQWQILLSIINKNRLLKYFVLHSFVQSNNLTPNDHQLLFTVLRSLLIHYLQFTKRKMSFHNFQSNPISQNYTQISTNYHHYQHQLQPSYFIELLAQTEPTYLQSQIKLHITLIKSIGAMTDIPTYQFYFKYIIGHECHKYNTSVLQLIIDFMQTLPSPLCTDFVNNLQYSIFKQSDQLKELICNVTHIKDVPFQSSPEKPNFNILSGLQSREVRKVSLGQQQVRQFLICLFRLLTLIETNSTTHKEILSKLTYKIMLSIVIKYNDSILLKHSILNFILTSIEKQMRYSMTKYLKTGQDANAFSEEQQQTEEYEFLTHFIHHTNYLLKTETDSFKNVRFLEQPFVFVKYLCTLLSVIRKRDSVSKYLHFEANQKLIRTNSHDFDVHRSPDKQNSVLLEEEGNESWVGREEDVLISRARHMMHYSIHINLNELQNIEGINKLISYEVVEAIERVFKGEEIPFQVQEHIVWLENNYKITLSSHCSLSSQPPEEQQLIYRLDHHHFYNFAYSDFKRANNFLDTYRNSLVENQAPSPSFQPQYQEINCFLSFKIQNYLVLLIQLLQRHFLIQQSYYKQAKEQKKHFLRQSPTLDQIIHLLILIEFQLNNQIRLYKISDQQYRNKHLQVLPEEYYHRYGVEVDEEGKEQIYKDKYCELQKKKIEVLLNLLMISHRLDKPILIYYLHAILERLTYFNITNQIHLQQLLAAHFHTYYEIIYQIIKTFTTISPIINEEFFVPKNLLHSERIQWSKIYSSSGKEVEQNVNNKEQYVNSLRGMRGYHLATLNYYVMIKMLLATSKTLNFQFKSLFSAPTIDKESILSELLDILQKIIDNSTVFTEQKFEFIRVTMKLINTFLRGPIEQNVQTAINKNYNSILIGLLNVLKSYQSDSQIVHVHVIQIKKLIAEGLFILIPFIEVNDQEIQLCQNELKNSYSKSRKNYNKHYANIISDYIDKKFNKHISLLYFDLALNYYYCLIEMYAKKKINKIHNIQIQILSQRRRKKEFSKYWKVFYQIYSVIASIISPIYRRLTSKYEDLTDKNDEQLLYRSILFFTKHVSQVDVKIYNKVKKISFLLLKEASSYNVSIRKEFHNLIGHEQRELRLHKFMKISKFVIIRLQTSKDVNKIISNFKPLEVIIINRQLWKSLSFFMALLLNVIFVFDQSLDNLDKSFFGDLRYGLVAITYTFLLFLYLIYFLEIIPLKVRVYRMLNEKQFKLRTLLVFIKDKTLAFVLFYTVFLTLSLRYEGFVSTLLFDYFFRFKMSGQITFIMFRSTMKIVYAVILVFTLLYISAILSIEQQTRTDQCQNISACTQDLFFIFMELRFNVNLAYTSQTLFQTLIIIPRVFLKFFNMSLMVGIIIMEKRKRQITNQQKQLKIRDICFICGNQRNAIEKARNSNKGFYYHVELEHNLWNYIYYLIYLKNKEKKNLNTIEIMIIEQWEKNQIDWLPDQIL